LLFTSNNKYGNFKKKSAMEKYNPITGCYKIATKAVHPLLGIVNLSPQLCYVYGEVSEDGVNYWVGRCLFIYNHMFNFKYPKSHTCELKNSNIKKEV